MNGIDQGAAGSYVPENVYGVIDIFGQTAQVSIVDQPGRQSFIFMPQSENFVYPIALKA